MAPPRLGLVGVGRWGRRYVDTIVRLPCAQLSAVTTSRSHGDLFPAGCNIFPSWPEMLDGAELDGVVLAVPPQLHRPIAEACIEHRLPVLVEKPMATTVDDAVAIAAAARRARVPVMVDHTHLFSPAFQRLRQMVGPGPLVIRGEGGDHGPVGRPVDPLWDWGPHDVAMCLALTGAMPTSVDARRASIKPDGGVLTEIVLRFDRGDAAVLTVGNAMEHKRRFLRVVDGDQVLVYDDLAPHKLTRQGKDGVDAVEVDEQWPLDRVVQDFVATIRSGAEEHESADRGVDVVRVLAAADHDLDQPSAAAGHPSAR